VTLSATLNQSGICRLQMENPMANDNLDPKSSRRGNISDDGGQGSQDAIRHEKDALHHKFHDRPRVSVEDERNDQQSQARAQQDSVEMQQIEGQQPEIPKVGSLDAPGG
jgi:hypothetical protein